MNYADDLSWLGFIKNGIVETIISTFDEKRNPHAAPMGVSTEDMRSILLKPYKSSETCHNLLKWRRGVANITSDPNLFHVVIFKRAALEREVSEDLFTHEEAVDAPRMRNVDACIAFIVENVEDFRDQVRIHCRVDRIIVTNRPVLKAYCRAAPAVIESLIHATRIETFLALDQAEKVEELMKMIDYYHSLVERIAPNSNYLKIMNDIQHRIKAWRNSEDTGKRTI